MAIESIELHIIPSVSTLERHFPNIWILDMVIDGRAGNLNDAKVYLNVVPYNAATNDIDMASPRELRISLIEYLMIPGEGGGPNPLMIAMGAVEQAVPWVESKILLKNAIPKEETLTPEVIKDESEIEV